MSWLIEIKNSKYSVVTSITVNIEGLDLAVLVTNVLRLCGIQYTTHTWLNHSLPTPSSSTDTDTS